MILVIAAVLVALCDAAIGEYPMTQKVNNQVRLARTGSIILTI